MAGIGFRLERILSYDSYTNLIKGYAYSAIVSAGPVLCTIFSIAMLAVIMPTGMSFLDVMIFRTLVVYIYAISLVTTSPMQMIITRYMSDRIFLNDNAAVVPSLVGIMMISLVLHACLGCVLVGYADLDLPSSVTAVILFLCIGMIWIAMIVLSAAKEFMWIVKSFFTGAFLSVIAGYLLGSRLGFLGLLGGFTLGQVVLVTLLLIQIFTEFEFRERVEFYFLSYFKKFTSLAFIAALYNIGIWADKFVFWFSGPTGYNLHGSLYISPIYDIPVFVAYLLIIPSLAMFTVKVETSFYVQYKKYFLSILNKHPLVSLEERRKNIVDTLRISMGRMIVMQGTITVIALFVAPKVYPYLGMTPMNLGVFQIAILATFLQALLQTLLIIMLYFDLRSDALFMSIVFATTNIFFSIWSVRLGLGWYGYGYFFACLAALISGFLIFNYRMKNLLYYTFVSQKIIVHRETVSA